MAVLRLVPGFRLLAAALPLAVCGQDAGGEDAFVFEGTVLRIEPRLAPTLREGLVISGELAADFSFAAADDDAAPERARFALPVTRVAVTFDRNHVWQYGVDAEAVKGVVLLEEESEVEAETLDLYSLLLPVTGDPAGNDSWIPRWLQLWFYGDPETTLDGFALQPPPASFSRGWWRLTFWKADGSESIVAEGRLTASGPAGEPLSTSAEMAQLEDLVADLGSRLNTSESRVAQLETDLAKARRRVDGLQRTLDVLIEERQELLVELERWRAEGTQAPAALRERIAALEVEAALATESRESLAAENRALADALAKSQVALSDAFARERRLQAEAAARPLQPGPETPVPPPSTARFAPAPVAPPIVVLPTSVTTVSSRADTPASPAVSATVDPVAAPVVAAPEAIEPERSTPGRRPGKFGRRLR